MLFQEIVRHYLNLLYMTLILIGLFFSVPFIRRVLVSDISLLNLVMVVVVPDPVADEVFVVARATGTKTTLFQFSDLPLLLFMAAMSPAILLNV